METDRKIYKATAVRVGALLGGPLAAAYLLANNFRALGQPENVGKTWAISIGVSVVLFGLLFSLPEEISDKIPRILISLVTMVVAQLVVTKYQEPGLQQFLEEEGEAYSIWRAVGMALLLAVTTLMAVVVAAMVVDSLLWGDSNGVRNLYRHR